MTSCRIGDEVRRHAAEDPRHPAVVDGANRLDYGQLASEVERLSRLLAAAGISHGDRVACLDDPGLAAWTSFLATTDLGGIWVGLNPRYTEAELRHPLENARPRLLIARRTADEDRGEMLLRLATSRGVALWWVDEKGIVGGEKLPPASPIRHPLHPDAALIVYTSGTTGVPKGALLTHHGLLFCSRRQNMHVALGRARVLCNLPISHIGAIGDICCTTLTAGGTLIFMPGFQPGEIPSTIAREQVTVWGQVPLMFMLTMRQPGFDAKLLSGLSAIRWGGAALPPALLPIFRQLGVAVGTDYGQTETTGSVTFTGPDADDETLLETVGRPVDAESVRLANEDGRVVPPGEAGEIQVRGSWIMAGYWQDPDATVAAFTADGWLRTGDLAIERPDGCLRLVGRLREMFKSGGYNVYPREIEAVLEQDSDVALAAVVSRLDPLYGEVGAAFVVAMPFTNPSPTALLARCRQQLAAYKVPKSLEILAELPLLANGKINRAALAARFSPMPPDA